MPGPARLHQSQRGPLHSDAHDNQSMWRCMSADHHGWRPAESAVLAWLQVRRLSAEQHQQTPWLQCGRQLRTAAVSCVHAYTAAEGSPGDGAYSSHCHMTRAGSGGGVGCRHLLRLRPPRQLTPVGYVQLEGPGWCKGRVCARALTFVPDFGGDVMSTLSKWIWQCIQWPTLLRLTSPVSMHAARLQCWRLV